MFPYPKRSFASAQDDRSGKFRTSKEGRLPFQEVRASVSADVTVIASEAALPPNDRLAVDNAPAGGHLAEINTMAWCVDYMSALLKTKTSRFGKFHLHTTY